MRRVKLTLTRTLTNDGVPIGKDGWVGGGSAWRIYPVAGAPLDVGMACMGLVNGPGVGTMR